MITKIALAVMLTMTLLFAECFGSGGPLSKLDSTLDFAPLFFQGLVISGAINQEQADRYKQGVNRFESIADTTKKCLADNIVADAQCYVDMSNSARLALAEFYPATNNSKVSEYAALINDIVALIIQKNVPTVGGVDENVDERLDQKIDQLDRLLKGR